MRSDCMYCKLTDLRGTVFRDIAGTTIRRLMQCRGLLLLPVVAMRCYALHSMIALQVDVDFGKDSGVTGWAGSVRRAQQFKVRWQVVDSDHVEPSRRNSNLAHCGSEMKARRTPNGNQRLSKDLRSLGENRIGGLCDRKKRGDHDVSEVRVDIIIELLGDRQWDRRAHVLHCSDYLARLGREVVVFGRDFSLSPSFSSTLFA